MPTIQIEITAPDAQDQNDSERALRKYVGERTDGDTWVLWRELWSAKNLLQQTEFTWKEITVHSGTGSAWAWLVLTGRMYALLQSVSDGMLAWRRRQRRRFPEPRAELLRVLFAAGIQDDVTMLDALVVAVGMIEAPEAVRSNGGQPNYAQPRKLLERWVRDNAIPMAEIRRRAKQVDTVRRDKLRALRAEEQDLRARLNLNLKEQADV